jgi:hypothetical protein
MFRHRYDRLKLIYYARKRFVALQMLIVISNSCMGIMNNVTQSLLGITKVLLKLSTKASIILNDSELDVHLLSNHIILFCHSMNSILKTWI